MSGALTDVIDDGVLTDNMLFCSLRIDIEQPFSFCGALYLFCLLLN